MLSKEHLIKEQSSMEVEYVKLIHKMNYEQKNDIKSIEQKFDNVISDLVEKCENRKLVLESDYELRRKVDVHEVEERKNSHIDDLTRNHNKSYNQMKEYFNKITSDNLSLVKTLQSQIREIKKRSEMNKNALYESKSEFERLTGIFYNFIVMILIILFTDETSKETLKLSSMQLKLKQRNSDKLAFKNSLLRKTELDKSLKMSKQNLELLQKEYEVVENEFNSLQETYESVLKMTKDQNNKNLAMLNSKFLQIKRLDEENIGDIQVNNCEDRKDDSNVHY
jgi:hypothetical protein